MGRVLQGSTRRTRAYAGGVMLLPLQRLPDMRKNLTR